MARNPRIFVPAKQLQCCGKNVYPTKHQAKEVASQQVLLNYGLILNVYRCECGCGGWHLTRAGSNESASFEND